MGDFSTYLFAQPSFSEGVGRVLDFGDTLTVYNTSASPDEADAMALRMDFEAVGADLRLEIEGTGCGARQQLPTPR